MAKSTIGLEFVAANDYAMMRFWNGIANKVVAPGIGSNNFSPWWKPWVAEITGECKKYGFQRKFLKSKTDYSDANSKSSRGVMLWFILDNNRYFEVKGNKFRYFVKTDDVGNIKHDVSKDEVAAWVKNTSGSTC